MSSPTIYVAIDIIDDHVVRLTHGDLQQKTVYGSDPVETAIGWEAQGAQWLHVIDLDGATRGDQANSRAIERIIGSVSIPVQVGGGIRSIDAVERWIEAGAARVCVGTKSFDDAFIAEATSRFAAHLVVAVDSRGGEVKVGGWTQGSGIGVSELTAKLEDAGVQMLMFTDIDRDGALRGPNIGEITALLDSVSIPVIASGGVTTEHDIKQLAKLTGEGLEGIIIGKALYSGALTLAQIDEAIAGS